MGTYRTIPGAAEKILATLHDLRLTPVNPRFTPAVAASKFQRYYMTPVKNLRGEIVWFKASLQRDAHLRRALREEIRVQRLFAQYEKKFHPHFNSPSYIAHHDDHQSHLWLVRRYWDGMYAGDMTEWFGFAPAFFRAVGPGAMATIILDVHRMTHFFLSHDALETHGLGWYMLDFHYYQREFLRPMARNHPAPGWDRGRVDRLEEFLLSHRSFFTTQAKTFTHGDMYPTNIMIRATTRRPVVLFDWELAHLNLPTFDAVMIYLHAWRKPAWQKAFRERMLRGLGNTPAAQLSWQLATASLATRLAGFCYIRLHHAQPDRYPPLPKKHRATIARLYQYFLHELEAVVTAK